MRPLTYAVAIMTTLSTLGSSDAQADDHRIILTDTSKGIHTEAFEITNRDLGIDGPDWSVRKYTLHGGREEGVDIVEVNNGKLSFSVIPTRGMSIKGVSCGDVRFGWNSPVKETVNPAFINLDSNGGLGWLDGFNEMMVRCGYGWAGHPGDDNGRLMTLHGRAGNIPASVVEIIIDEKPPHRIRIRGQVNEKTFKFYDFQNWTEISTEPGSASFSLHDELTNLSDYDREFQLIYHANFGQTILEEGAEFVAAVEKVQAFDSAALDPKEYDSWTTYKGPTKGYGETVYCLEPYANKDDVTTVMLKNAKGTRGVACSYNIKQLPYFSLWKNTDTEKEGYVTGLEPSTSYPTTRAFEREAGRVPTLKGGATRNFNLTYTVLLDKEDVSETTATISKLQGKKKTTKNPVPNKKPAE